MSPRALSVPLLLASAATGVTLPCTAQLRAGEWAVGVHTGSNLNEPPPDLVRLGVQAQFRLTDVLSLVPSAAAIADNGDWQGSVHLRVDPAASHPTMPVYFGIGGTVIQFQEDAHHFYDVVLVGFEGRFRQLRPFTEVQVLDPIDRLVTGGGELGLQVHFGVSAVLTR